MRISIIDIYSVWWIVNSTKIFFPSCVPVICSPVHQIQIRCDHRAPCHQIDSKVKTLIKLPPNVVDFVIVFLPHMNKWLVLQKNNIKHESMSPTILRIFQVSQTVIVSSFICKLNFTKNIFIKNGQYNINFNKKYIKKNQQ